MIRLLLFLLLAGAVAGYSFWVYLRAELPVRNRHLLATLRTVALLGLLALLFDPRLPWGGAAGTATRWVLLDASLSMAVASGDAGAAVEGDPREGTSWSRALDRARELEEDGWRVVPFGGGVDRAAEPTATATELAPALRRAVEAGAGRIVVLSDLRLHDPVEAGGVLARARGAVEFEPVGGEVANAGLADLRVSDALRRDDPVAAEIDLFGDGSGDSLVVEVREEDRLVTTWEGTGPPAGLVRTIRVELPSPRGEGRVRYTATVRRVGDAFADDDVAVAYAGAGFEEDALVLVSLAPDWEPRYLLPVLEQVTGLPAVGYLRAGPDRFVPMGRAAERGPPVDSATVGRAASEAAVLVVHGLSGEADAWGRGLPERAGRVVAWPHDVAGAAAVGVEVAPAQGGEWYASSNLPPSPVASELAGQDFSGFPPLSEFFLVSDPVGSRPPLQVQLGGTGVAEAAVIFRREAGRRTVVPLTRGYWRWAARDGAPREGYRRLWAALAGWLLAPDETVGSPRVRPEAWVLPRGRPTRWLLPPAVDSVRLSLVAPDSLARDTVLAGGGAGTAWTLPPGTYRFRAADTGGNALGDGRFDVAATTDELLPAPGEPATPPPDEAAEAGEEGGGRPLRTASWPYLLVLALLCAEWVGRRRAGLR